MEVVRGHNRTKPRLFGLFAPSQKVRRMELLEHRRVAYGARGFHDSASFVGSMSARALSGACQLLFGRYTPLRQTLVYSETNVCRSGHAAIHQRAEMLRAAEGGVL